MRDERPHEAAQSTFEDAYLGRGWAFPVRWVQAAGSPSTTGGFPVQMSARVEDIFQSIRIILETALGERVMRPEFGSLVHRFVFASIDAQTKTNLAHATRKALLLWERRIRDINVEVTEAGEGNRLDVEISFYVDTHRMRHSLVFPFYLDQSEDR